jgi:hypothetical protein
VAWRFKEFLSVTKGLDEAAFLTRFPHPVLLSDGLSAASATGRVSGNPATTKLAEDEPQAPPGPPPVTEPEDAYVVPIMRRDTSEQRSIITVGRGDECDIRLTHPLVSKKHAYFTQDADGWLLADAESTNCTFVDGNKLVPHKAVRVVDSTAIRFGPVVKYRFFTPQTFHGYCALRARVREQGAAKQP